MKRLYVAQIYVEWVVLVASAALFEVEIVLLVPVATAVALVTAEVVTKPLVSSRAKGWFQRI